MPSAASLKPSAKTVGVVGLAVAVAVLDQPDPLVVDLILAELLGLEVLPVHRHPVGDGPAGHVGVEPVHVAPVVGDARVEPERLGDEEPPALVDAERHRVGQHRLGGEQLDLQARRQPDRLDRLRRLGRGRGDLRLVQLVLGPGRGGADAGKQAASAAAILDRCIA